VPCGARCPAAHATTGVDVAPSAAAKGAGSEHVAGREVPGASGKLLEVWVKVRKGCGLRVGSEVRGGCARLLFSLRADRSSSSSFSSLTMPPGAKSESSSSESESRVSRQRRCLPLELGIRERVGRLGGLVADAAGCWMAPWFCARRAAHRVSRQAA
jgi:hypothetical protein